MACEWIDRCGSCRFYDAEDSLCRRRCPRPTQEAQWWPPVLANDWCGDFERLTRMEIEHRRKKQEASNGR